MPGLASQFEVNRIEGGGFSSPIAAAESTTEFGTNLYIYFDDGGNAETAGNISSATIGSNAFVDSDLTDSWDGEGEYYGFRTVGGSGDPISVGKIASNGEITQVIVDLENLGSFSVTGSIPYVDYYAGSFLMYKTGSKHYNSIEGAVSQSCVDKYINFSGSDFQDFIAQAIPEAFDESIVGKVITNPSTEISSSIQFQGYPHSGSIGSGITDEP